MTILSGDIKLVASSVMSDAPESGGPPSPNIVADAVSNAIYPDISELDRAGGRVNLRKVFASVQTTDTDTFLGTNVIVAEPPADPRVSITLFSTGDVFDTRAEAATRIESYLTRGALAAGFLYENHIQGQAVVQLFQRPDADVPVIGQTLVLIQNENLSNEKVQYVRSTSVSKQVRLFYDQASMKDYEAAVVTVEISDSLREDFTGSPASRTFSPTTLGTRIRETLVADAGVYAGVQPLVSAATTGDFTITAASIFTQLVPSAQTETPISDVKTNGLSTALVACGAMATQSLATIFDTTHAMFVGGPVYPGSLSITFNGATITDLGGVMYQAGEPVGTVDYDNGVVALSVNVYWGQYSNYTVTFQPATATDLISNQSALPITAESRSLSYVFTLASPPLPGALTISYMAQGRWYVLRDDKGGVLKGGSTAFGAGTVNYTTGGVLLTLGALPDVGSAIVISSYSAATTVNASNTDLLNGGRVFAVMNTSGDASDTKGAKAITPSGLSIVWSNGGTKTATDDGLGNLTGDATGTVDYSSGVVKISPNTLPAPGAIFLMDVSGVDTVVANNVNLSSGSLGATAVTPGSILFSTTATITCTAPSTGSSGGESTSAAESIREVALTVYDRAGGLYFRDAGNQAAEVACGTVNYTTGVLTLNFTPTVAVSDTGGPNVSTHYPFVFTLGAGNRPN